MTRYSSYAKKFGTVSNTKGVELAIGQPPYLGDVTRHWGNEPIGALEVHWTHAEIGEYFTAIAYQRDPHDVEAVDEAHPFRVIWPILPEVLQAASPDRPDDESTWCDWEKYFVIPA